MRPSLCIASSTFYWPLTIGFIHVSARAWREGALLVAIATRFNSVRACVVGRYYVLAIACRLNDIYSCFYACVRACVVGKCVFVFLDPNFFCY